MLREDGSILSANTPAVALLAKNRAAKDSQLYRGMVFRIYYVDDPANVTRSAQNPEVVYDVIVTSGPYEGQVFTNVRSSAVLGGQYNFSEKVYRAASKPFAGAGSVPLNQQDGDIVYIECVNGDISSAVITGLGTHPLDTDNTGSTASDGPRSVEEYNGVNTSIDKNGVLSITRRGGSYQSSGDYFKPALGANEAQMKLEENKLTLGVKENALTQVLNGASDSATLKTAGGLVVTHDGKNDVFTIVCSGGSKVSIDGKNKVIKVSADAGNCEIVIDAQSGKIQLVGSLVEIGKQASALAVLGPQMLAWLTSHIHPCPQAPSGVLNSLPPAVPPPASMLSGTVTVQK